LRFVFLSKLRKPQPKIIGKPIDSTSPPVAPSDHRGLDEEMFPTTRRPQLPFPGRSFIGVVLCRLNGLEFFRGFLRREFSELGVGGNPAFTARNRIGRRAIGRCIRNLSKRKVLRESPR
jgi:hypothetical protein